MNNSDFDLFGQFVRLEWLLHRYHQHNHRHHGPLGDPHRGQGRVLALLKLKPEISQKELSEILDIRSQSLGELLAKLERNGYITRTPSPTDRRVMNVHLTEAGRESSAQKEQHADIEALFDCLNEEEQATLSDYLSRIILALEQQYAGEPEAEFQGHPPFEGRGFDRHFGMEGGHPPFHGRGLGRHFGMEGGRPPFDGRGFGRHSGMEGKRPPFDGRDYEHHHEERDKPNNSNSDEEN
ncbi:MarR family transcriptional regulator [Desulfosporosinus sp. PR]|uniref:MarR family winged helix-turn-helix transcriptional regulator n=1 Tax=Candidatus Desulfosporosinus nitrosoreducens TaxID=3401928 RepID=UPI0027F00641|nr:MarR family transcriptional regulator [Desulfosporosinus sp. PR]MDQ7092330.1 MarR family transcriptional regulator [Desulfosporosinus sp. PR]